MVTRTTYAQFRSMADPLDVEIYIQGRDTAGDDGRGYFYRVGTALFTADDDGVDLVQNLGGFHYRRIYHGDVNVLWYGAKDNGTGNSASAFQKALAKGNVFVPYSAAGYNIGDVSTPGTTLVLKSNTRITFARDTKINHLAKGTGSPTTRILFDIDGRMVSGGPVQNVSILGKPIISGTGLLQARGVEIRGNVTNVRIEIECVDCKQHGITITDDKTAPQTVCKDIYIDEFVSSGEIDTGGQVIEIYPMTQNGDLPACSNLQFGRVFVDVTNKNKEFTVDHGDSGIKVGNFDTVIFRQVPIVRGSRVGGVVLTDGVRNVHAPGLDIEGAANGLVIASARQVNTTATENISLGHVSIRKGGKRRNAATKIDYGLQITGNPRRVSFASLKLDGLDALIEESAAYLYRVGGGNATRYILDEPVTCNLSGATGGADTLHAHTEENDVLALSRLTWTTSARPILGDTVRGTTSTAERVIQAILDPDDLDDLTIGTLVLRNASFMLRNPTESGLTNVRNLSIDSTIIECGYSFLAQRDVNIVTNTIRIPNHGLSNGTPVMLLGDANEMPAPLQPEVPYYAMYVSIDEFQLSATQALPSPPGLVAINLTHTGYHELTLLARIIHQEPILRVAGAA